MDSIKSHHEDKAFLLAAIALIGMAASITYHYVVTWYGPTPLGYPFNTFLYKPSEYFSDFNAAYCGNYPNPYSCFQFVYFPFAAYSMKVLTSFSGGKSGTLHAMLLLFTASSFLVSFLKSMLTAAI